MQESDPSTHESQARYVLSLNHKGAKGTARVRVLLRFLSDKVSCPFQFDPLICPVLDMQFNEGSGMYIVIASSNEVWQAYKDLHWDNPSLVAWSSLQDRE